MCAYSRWSSVSGRGSRHARSSGAICACTLLLIAGTACDPPGKPKADDSAQEVTDFKTLYRTNCIGCHGEDGKNGPGRILNDPLYLAVLPKDTLKQILTYGRAGTAMPAWARSQGGPLSERQINALVEGIEKNWARSQDFSQENLPAYTAKVSGHSDAGKKVFARSCFMCHGKGAAVGPVTDPGYLSLVSDQVLRTSVIVGRSDLGMPDYRTLKMGRPLSDEEIADVVAYLVSLRPHDSNNVTLNASGTPMTVTTGQNAIPDAGSVQSEKTGMRTEGSGNGPGSHRKDNSGSKSSGNSSQQGVK